MADEKKRYNSRIGSFFDGGAKERLTPKVENLDAAQQLLADTEKEVMLGAGVSRDEAEAYHEARTEQIASDYEANLKAVNSLSTTNTIINVASITPIALKAGGKVASSLATTKVGSKVATKVAAFSSSGTRVSDIAKNGTQLIKDGHVLKGVGQYAKAGTVGIGRVAVKTFDAVDGGFKKAGEKIAGKAGAKAAGDVAYDILDSSGKVIGKGVAKEVAKETGKAAAKAGSKGLAGLARTAIGATVSKGAYIAPIVAAQMYTRGRVDDMDKDLSDALALVLDRTDYINTEGGKLTDEAGQAYNDWNDTYSAAMADLSDKLDKGEITKAQFDKLYEEQSKAQAEALKELDGKYPDMARKMVTEGEAYRIADTGAKTGADLDDVKKYDSQVKELMQEYPEAEALYQEESAKLAELDTGSSFGNFISSMHAALVHYLPGFAYVEAAAVKVADMALGFVANNVPVIKDAVSYEEHYKGQSLTSMAASIVDTAEARYEKQGEADAISEKLADGQKSWQEAAGETREAGGDLQASPA